MITLVVLMLSVTPPRSEEIAKFPDMDGCLFAKNFALAGYADRNTPPPIYICREDIDKENKLIWLVK